MKRNDWAWMVAVLASFGLVGCKPEAERLRDLEAADKAAAEAAAKPPMPDQVAKAGVGVKGDSLDSVSPNSPGGIIAQPAKTFFKVKERIVFEIQLPKQMDLFKASNGRPPKSHEEYMREVVTDSIKLPELPRGMVYRYHPDTAELWVEAEKKVDNAPSQQNP
jgi:hypothetical protein